MNSIVNRKTTSLPLIAFHSDARITRFLKKSGCARLVGGVPSGALTLQKPLTPVIVCFKGSSGSMARKQKVSLMFLYMFFLYLSGFIDPLGSMVDSIITLRQRNPNSISNLRQQTIPFAIPSATNLVIAKFQIRCPVGGICCWARNFTTIER